MSSDYEIREALDADEPAIIEFNCRLAWETEGKRLDRPTVERGVRAVLSDAAKARYLVAVHAGQPVGQLMQTWEWSDWRNGMFWWLQSVYVMPEHRGCGVFRRLFEHLRRLAEDDGGVVGVRLYVEDSNADAQRAYQNLGFIDAGYRVMERAVPPC